MIRLRLASKVPLAVPAVAVPPAKAKTLTMIASAVSDLFVPALTMPPFTPGGVTVHQGFLLGKGPAGGNDSGTARASSASFRTGFTFQH